MRCKYPVQFSIYVYLSPVFNPFNSERGVRSAPDVLPSDYKGGDADQGSLEKY